MAAMAGGTAALQLMALGPIAIAIDLTGLRGLMKSGFSEALRGTAAVARAESSECSSAACEVPPGVADGTGLWRFSLLAAEILRVRLLPVTAQMV